MPTTSNDGIEHRVFTATQGGDCDLPGLFDLLGQDPWALPNQTQFEVFVYHPQDSTGAWPEGLEDRPVVFMSPGNGFDLVGGSGTSALDHLYLHTIETLVEDGFVVFGIQPVTTAMSTRQRRAALACTMLWARDDWQPDAGTNTPPSNPLSEYTVLLGHSRGGTGAYLLTEDLLTGAHLPSGTSLDDWQQCATVSYAQSYAPGSPDEFAAPITELNAPPLLAMSGTIDEQTTTDSVTAFDNRISETQEDTNDTVATWDETAIVVHGASHTRWGGVMGVNDAIGPYYTSQFLHWQMLGDDAGRRRIMDLVDAEVDACAFDDLAFAAPTDWDGDLEIYYEGCEGPTPPAPCVADPTLELEGLGRPLIYADVTQGTMWPGADRHVIDTMDRDGSVPCARYFDVTPVDGVSVDFIGESSAGAQVRVATTGSPGAEGGPCVCMGGVAFLNTINVGTMPEVPDACTAPGGAFGNPGHDAHDGNAMLVHFGDDFGPATVEWSLMPSAMEGDVVDVSDFTHLSVRIANVVTDENGCDGVPDEFTVTAALRDEDGDASQPSVDLGPLVESDSVNGGDGGECRSAQFMRTFRVPLASLCEQGGLAITMASAVALTFDDPDQSHVALVDSIELVRDPTGAAPWPAYQAASCNGLPPPPPACATAPPSTFDCEAAPTLVATETACVRAPSGGACAPSDVITTPVSLPVVDAGTPGAYAGWIVNVPTGWVADPHNPTAAEIDDIAVRCTDACKLEYADQPFVAANCAPAEFLSPTVRSVDERPARTAVLDSAADGSGLFPGQTLDCDLRDDCCAADFDEALCAARPHRPTDAGQPLTRGEEYVVSIAGVLTADSSAAETPQSADVVGTVGYTQCTAGTSVAPCPFYVGSLDLQLQDAVALELKCGNDSAYYSLDDLSVSLVQPALGMAQQGSDKVSFPAGSLILAADGEINGMPFAGGGATLEVVGISADGGDFALQSGASMALSAPCGNGVEDVVAWLTLADDTVLEHPPTVTVDPPASVRCPEIVDLTANANDVDGDLSTVRWVVDGVLLDSAATSIEVAEDHTLTAIARDARGATATASQTVVCQ